METTCVRVGHSAVCRRLPPACTIRSPAARSAFDPKEHSIRAVAIRRQQREPEGRLCSFLRRLQRAFPTRHICPFHMCWVMLLHNCSLITTLGSASNVWANQLSVIWCASVSQGNQICERVSFLPTHRSCTSRGSTHIRSLHTSESMHARPYPISNYPLG